MVTPQSLQAPSVSCCQALFTLEKFFPMHKCSLPYFSLHLSSLAVLHRTATQCQSLLQPEQREAWPSYMQTFFIPFTEADSLPNAQSYRDYPGDSW